MKFDHKQNCMRNHHSFNYPSSHYDNLEDIVWYESIDINGNLIDKCVACRETKERLKIIKKEEKEREKKELTTDYIKDFLSKKFKVKKEIIPNEIIELQRENLKLKDKIESIFKCKIHGKLDREFFTKNGKDSAGNIIFVCKLCRKEIRKKHYTNNKEKVLAKCKKYKEENREMVLEKKRKYFQLKKEEKNVDKNNDVRSIKK